MATIQFKAKIKTIYNMDDTEAYKRIKIPVLKKAHCDMNAFRVHPKFGGFANSDLFPNILARISRDVAKDGYIRLDKLPDNVSLDYGGYLTTVKIEV